jgi:hypothetical protein
VDSIGGCVGVSIFGLENSRTTCFALGGLLWLRIWLGGFWGAKELVSLGLLLWKEITIEFLRLELLLWGLSSSIFLLEGSRLGSSSSTVFLLEGSRLLLGLREAWQTWDGPLPLVKSLASSLLGELLDLPVPACEFETECRGLGL